MTLKVFAIRDSKGEFFTPPFYKKTAGEAERDFHQLVNDANSMVHKYPEDYDLYYIGEFNDQDGKIKSLDSPSHICKAVNLKKASNLAALAN